MHCLMVDACAASAEAACKQLQSHHQQLFMQQHPGFKFPATIPCDDVAIIASPPPSSLPLFLDYFVSLEPPHRLSCLLSVARCEYACVGVHDVLSCLPDWATFSLSECFESYGQLQAQAPHLPLHSEEYFREVFAACHDDEQVKHGMLEKRQRFVQEIGLKMFGRLLIGDGREHSEAGGGGDTAAAKKRNVTPE
jgi:hypothetical protein